MRVAIVDYGMGNLHSVLKSVQAAQVLSKQNAEVYLTSRPEEVRRIRLSFRGRAPCRTVCLR